jgi:hypothetical protein
MANSVVKEKHHARRVAHVLVGALPIAHTKHTVHQTPCHKYPCHQTSCHPERSEGPVHFAGAIENA